MNGEEQNIQSVTGRDRLVNWLFHPLDNASLVFFRIAFGLIMTWEWYRYFSKGWIKRHYIDPDFHFKYLGFEWVEPLPGNAMYGVFALMMVFAVMIALGLFYRLAVSGHLVLFLYMFLIEQARYLNHFYFALRLNFILIFTPANRAFALDPLIWPALRSQFTPAWAVYWLRFQIAVLYIFGGIHKTNPDWLLSHQPMGMMLAGAQDKFPDVVSQYFTEAWAAALFAYGGLLLDLFVVPFLLWRKTRIPAFIAATAFHLMNSQIFTIGIFPWLMIAITTIFFEPDWPRRLLRHIRRLVRRKEPVTPEEPPQQESAPVFPLKRRLLVGFIAFYVLVQVLVPFRPYLYPGHILWQEGPLWFSWNMMLAKRQTYALFEVHDKITGRREKVDPVTFLTNLQMLIGFRRADTLLQLAHYIAEEERKRGNLEVAVYCHALSSLNGREPQLLVDNTVDLSEESRTLAPSPWIVPLEQQRAPTIDELKMDAWRLDELAPPK